MSMRDFDFMKEYTNQYLPDRGEGENRFQQAITAINKLVFKWFNDGDVYDNVHQHAVPGFANDLSSYANWLSKYAGEDVAEELMYISDVETEDDYEEILENVARMICDEKFKEKTVSEDKIDSIYSCTGRYKFTEIDEDDEGWEDEEDEEWEEEEEE